VNRLFGLLVCCAILAACGGAPAAPAPTSTLTPASPTSAPAPTSAATAAPAVSAPAAGFPVTIENCGRTLTFDAPPERVVSLWQPPTELLLALGVQDRIVALAGTYTDIRPDLAPLAEGIPVIGTSMAWPSKEVLLSQQPDLVISEGLEGFAYDPANGYATVAEIEATGAQVISTGGSCTPTDPASLTKSTETVYNDLRMLGQIFGVGERAEALIAELQAREAEVVAKVAGREPVKVAFYNGGDGPLFVLSFGIWADLIAKAGGADVIQTDDFQISVEEFAASQPDVILIGVYPGQEAEDRIAFLKATFPNVPAVQNDRLAPIPTIDTEASVRVIDGLEQIARALHPEAFEGTAMPAITPTTPDLSAFPVTVESCGRTLTFAKPPERVYTTYWNSADLLIRLGLGDRIVANAYQGDTNGGDIAAQYRAIPTQFEKYPSKEEVFALEPDFILASYDTFDFRPETGTPALEDVLAANIPVYGMSTECGSGKATEATFAMVYDDIRNVGKIFGVSERAEALITDMQDRIAAVQTKIAGRTPVKALIYYGGEGPLGIFSNGVYGDILKLAGGETIFPDTDNTAPQVSIEEVAARAPEVFLCIEYGTSFADMQTFLFNTFSTTPAGQSKRAALVPDGTTPAGYRTVAAIEEFASVFHPEAFE
jgi:iron complex transport system substrate-binding protein